jgi:hypothetical protein
MADTVRFESRVQFLDRVMTTAQDVSPESIVKQVVSVPGAKTGSLTSRVDSNSGTLTLASGHGITTGARIDVYWAGGARYGMVAGTVAGTSVPVNGGLGDNLPAESTALTAASPRVINFAIVGDYVSGLALATTHRGTVVIASAAGVPLLTRLFDGAGVYKWSGNEPDPNPLAGVTAALAYLSHAATTAKQMTAVAAINPSAVASVPPTIIMPEDAVVDENNSVVITGITIVDPDGTPQVVTLAVTHGTTTLGQTTGLTFTTGDGTADATMAFSGTLANVNAALASLTYTPTADYFGSASITVTTLDTSGLGATATLPIEVTETPNDPPSLTMWGDEDCEEAGGTVQLDNAFTVADADDATLEVTIDVQGGDDATLTLAGTTGLTFTVGDGTADTAMTFSGTPSAINTALRGSVFTAGPESEATQEAAILVTVSDGTNTPVEGETAVFIVEAPPAEPPVLANVTGTTTYDHAYDGTPIAPALTIASDTDITGATVVLSGGDSTGDRAIDSEANGTGWSLNGITWAWNNGTRTLTGTGTASAAEYQAQLRTMKYDVPNAISAPGVDRTATFTVSNIAGASNQQARTITGVVYFSGDLGQWNWLGIQDPPIPMAAGQASYDGADVPLFSAINAAAVNQTKRLRHVEGDSEADAFEGHGGRMASIQDETSYWSIYWVDGEGAAYEDEPGGTKGLSITSPPVPSPPGDLTQNNGLISDPITEVGFTFTPGGDAHLTRVQYRIGAGEWIDLTTIGIEDPAEIMITGLDPETAGEVRIRSEAGGWRFSDWVTEGFLTDPEEPE